jgi:hypothetical protein
VSVRAWLALVAAAIVGALVYASLTLASIPDSVAIERPTFLGLVVSGAVVASLFAVAVLAPLFLAGPTWRSLRGVTFIFLGAFLWFIVFLAGFLATGMELNAAVATALQLLGPGIVVVVVFWVLVRGNYGA